MTEIILLFKKPVLWLTVVLFYSAAAHAQYQRTNWWALNYDFNQEKINESDATEIGHFPLLDIELGVNMTGNTAIAIHGLYGENTLTYDGATISGTQVNQSANARKFDLRGDFLYLMNQVFLNFGYGARSFSDGVGLLPGRESTIHYLPVGATYWMFPFYIKGEYLYWLSGSERVVASMLGGGRQDVSLKQNDGNGFAIEGGYLIPRPIGVRLFLQLQKWHIAGSSTQFDGVENLSEPEQEITETTIGLGLIF